MKEFEETILVLLIIVLIGASLYFIISEKQKEEMTIITYQEWTPQQVKSTIDSWNCYRCIHIIDVRANEEFLDGYIYYNNSMVWNVTNIDFGSIRFINNLLDYDENHNKYGLKKDNYIIYSKSGEEGLQVLELMTQMGFKNVYNMKGGFNQWVEEGYPITNNGEKQ